jgi:hypothetical protein
MVTWLPVEIQYQGRVAVHAQDEDVFGQRVFQHGQTTLAHVAEASVVVAAFGIVIVRDDRDR